MPFQPILAGLVNDTTSHDITLPLFSAVISRAKLTLISYYLSFSRCIVLPLRRRDDLLRTILRFFRIVFHETLRRIEII